MINGMLLSSGVAALIAVVAPAPAAPEAAQGDPVVVNVECPGCQVRDPRINPIGPSIEVNDSGLQESAGTCQPDEENEANDCKPLAKCKVAGAIGITVGVDSVIVTPWGTNEPATANTEVIIVIPEDEGRFVCGTPFTFSIYAKDGDPLFGTVTIRCDACPSSVGN